jgi:gluconolactonase
MMQTAGPQLETIIHWNKLGKTIRKAVFLLPLACFALQAFSQADTMKVSSLVADGAKPILISSQFKFTEGPATDKKGNVFFTDQPNNQIWKYGTNGKLTLFLDKAGRSNGQYFDKKGNLVTAADENNQLWSISPKGEVTVLVDKLDGKLFNGPNDLWIHPESGGIYFTDPYYQRDYWTRKKSEIEGQKVYYVAQGSKTAVAVAANLKQPNGIIGTPDGKYLYVADIGDRKTYRYTIAADGTLSDATVLINQGSDGMTLDNMGNIYLTGNGVTVYSSEGKKLEQIPIPEGWTANVTFGGKKRDKLFITASKSVYILDMKVRGAK